MTTATWVEAGPFRAHLQHLMATADLTAHEVATLAGISGRVADSLLAGRHGRPVRRISHATALALLHVRLEHAQALRTYHLPAGTPRQRVLRLLAAGLGPVELAEQLGTLTSTVQELADGTMRWCPALLALRLVTLSRARLTATADAGSPAAAGEQRAA